MDANTAEKWLKRLSNVPEEEYDKQAALTLEAISMIEEPLLEEIAINRYIYRRKWLDIAGDAFISKSTIYRYRTKIIAKMAKIIRKEGYVYEG